MTPRSGSERRASGPSHRYRAVDLWIVGAIAVVVLILGLSSSGAGHHRAPRVDTHVLVDVRGAPIRTVPTGFLGLSIEYPALPAYAGTDPSRLNPLFLRIVRELSPGQRPVLRIGGMSADESWMPAAGGAKPPWATFTLTPSWLSLAHAVAVALDARMILGVNLEADSSALAGAESKALLSGVGRAYVRALELGNEPDLYGIFPWYHVNGRKVTGRPSDWNYAAYAPDFAQIASAIPPYPLAAPSLGTVSWAASIPNFLSTQSSLGLVTLHRYPLQSCFAGPGSPRYPTIGHLLGSASSTGLADTMSGLAAVAHQHHLPLRLDELNSVACGAVPAVSNTFASALWAPDILFEMVRGGIDGVNIHTFPGAGYELFTVSHSARGWSVAVAPEFYGLLLFGRAAPPGAKLLAQSGGTQGAVKVWSTLAPDHRVRVLIINKDLRHGHAVAVRIVGAGGTAVLQRLVAPSASGSTKITLAGQRFADHSTSGRLRGDRTVTDVDPSGSRYTVVLSAASAALLTLPPTRG